MTVCVTGDVHHMSLGTREQSYLDGTEVEAAIEYARIAAEHDVPVTLFVTGKAAVEEPDRVERLATMDNVEIGGHNYWAFGTPVHAAWRAVGKLTGGRVGSWNGPKAFQAYEIGKTIAAFANLGIEITSWRDHAYRRDSNTAHLLADHGVTHLSDAVDPDDRVHREDGVTVVPINTPPDHEHLYHAFRTPEFVATNEFDGPFSEKSYEPPKWCARVLESVTEHKQHNRVATILAHPSCMGIADDFRSFERLCSEFADKYCRHMGDINP